MEELSTKQNNLVCLLYNDPSIDSDLLLQSDLEWDTLLADEYEMLKEAKQALPKALFNPSDSVLNKILNYSRVAAHEHYC